MNENFKETTNSEKEIKDSIKNDLINIKNNYQKNIIIPLNLYDLDEHLILFLKYDKDKNNDVTNLITINYLYFFRIALIHSKSQRITILNILRNCIKINPLFTSKILDAMIPIVICNFFEDVNLPFEVRYYSLKIFLSWLKLNDSNFPIIFLQSIAAIAKIEDTLKIGCIEFLRITSISRPDLVSTVNGFNILLNSLIEDNLSKDLINKIISSLVYILNTPNKRKYFNGFGEFYKIFSIFTKSDFTTGIQNNSNKNAKEKEEIRKENEKLEKRLNATIPIIIKFLLTWPGYCYILRDKFNVNSLLMPLNNDVNVIIKKAILKLFREILSICNNIYYNFNMICSENQDYFYINKIYIAFIIKELYSSNLNEHFIKFIEEIDSDELRNDSVKILIKFNILFTKVLNTDLRSTFSDENIKKFKWYETPKDEINKSIKNVNDLFLNDHILDYYSKINNIKRPIQIKIMHIIDVVFHHLECRDTSLFTPQTISSEIILATNNMLNIDYIKKYKNQYSIGTAKEKIYSKEDENILNLKNSKILEPKEFQLWDWTQIDSLFDIIEVQKDLISELNKQKIFKKLLYVYSPSKNLIANMPWIVNNFFYGAIGKKIFKVLIDNPDGIEILDSPNEDTIFQKANSWIKDVMQCLEEIFENSENEENPFSIKRIYNTLSRNTFIYIGIISNSKLGDDYLNKQGFYSLLNKFIIGKSNKFDYLLILFIDNVNFNSKHTCKWIQKIIESGNNDIKKYILNHIRCLLQFGKEVMIDIRVFIYSLNQEFKEIDKIIVKIIDIMIIKGKISYPAFKEKAVREKISKVDKFLLHILMRDEKIFNYLIDIIKKEIEKIDVFKLVEEYAKEMNESVIEVFNPNEESMNKFYLNINLSELKDKYNNFYEYFWIKQLPLSILVKKKENNDKRYEYILINYLEYNAKNNIIKINSKIQGQKTIIINENSGIQIICFLGKIALSKNCNSINNISNFITLNYKDIVNNIVPYKSYKNKFIMEKDNINLILIQNEDKVSYTLRKLFFNIQIRPNPIVGLKTPINLITELFNSERAVEIIEPIKAFEKLTSYLDIVDPDIKDKNSSRIRSSIYMLTKILMKKNAKYLNEKYEIVNKMVKFFAKCTDYSMKGTLIYITSFLALNEELRADILKLRTSYFCNTAICYPTVPALLDFEEKTDYENVKLEEDMCTIESEIKLNKISEKIYDNITSLLNNITANTATEYLKRTFLNKKECFMDINLFIKVYAVLTGFQFKPKTRKFLMEIFWQSICSNEIALEAVYILKNLGDNLLNANNLE